MRQWIYILCETKNSSNKVKKLLIDCGFQTSFSVKGTFPTCFGINIKDNFYVNESTHHGKWETDDSANVETYILGADLTKEMLLNLRPKKVVTMKEVCEKFGCPVLIKD